MEINELSELLVERLQSKGQKPVEGQLLRGLAPELVTKRES
jgi:hypothetical protein